MGQCLPAALPVVGPLLPPEVEEVDDEAVGVVADVVLEDALVELSDPGVVVLAAGVVEVLEVTDAEAAVADVLAEPELPQAARSANGLMRAAAEIARRVVVIPVRTTQGPRRLASV